MTAFAVKARLSKGTKGFEKFVLSGLALCSNGAWLALSRLRAAGSACAANEPEGTSAIDPADKQTLICKNGTFMRLAAFQSNFVLKFTQELQFSNAPQQVSKPICDEPRAGLNTDPATNANVAPKPLIILNSENEALPIQANATFSGINRFAVDNGTSWSVHLERSADSATLEGLTLVSVYCHYP
jgi:hypothetical protein